jgi:hypothetical protein
MSDLKKTVYKAISGNERSYRKLIKQYGKEDATKLIKFAKFLEKSTHNQ